jgi:branched-chain amino acid transport system ATP-binding protein
MDLLEIKQIKKYFGGICALDDISFSVKRNEIFGIVGPNGAGKTTIFNLATGAYSISNGSIVFDGKIINGMRADQIIDLGVARTFQNIRLFKKLNAVDNIKAVLYHSASYNIFDALIRTNKYRKIEKIIDERAGALLKEMQLDKYSEMLSNNLSYGLQRKLEIARALALEPKLLLLDEPAAGMNPKEISEIINLIREVHSRFNLTTIIIEHHMSLINNLCSHIVVLNFGKKIAEGTADEIQKDPNVIEAYLGYPTHLKKEVDTYVRN